MRVKKVVFILMFSFIFIFGTTTTLSAKEYDDYSVNLNNSKEFQLENYHNKTQKVSHKKEDSSKMNISLYQDSKKENSKAGEQVIYVNTNTNGDKVSTYKIEKNGKLKKFDSSDNSKTELNTIEVKDGQIIETNHGIIQTLGGYDSVKYMYPTLEDAHADTNGTAISGGGFDGAYLGTQKYQDNYYVHVYISGYEGYMNLQDVQIIPSSLIVSQSYYSKQNGDWIFHEAISPLTSTKYDDMAVGSAPSWAKENQKYYTVDDEHYFTKNIYQKGVTTNSVSQSATTYFQNLPMRSTAGYSGSQYQSYLKHMGYTKSQYYNATNAFVTAQDDYFMNSMMLFSLANHEGAYGTSNFSKTCNNFFGRGAIDSDPDQACEKYGFDTPKDGILAQAIFMTQNYADITWFGYHGSEFGDKSHGMNVSYASDPNWGKANASMMYNTDQYLGGKEEDKYRIYEIKNSEPVYTSSSLSSKVRLKPLGASEKNYAIPRNNSKNPRVVVTDETSNAFKIELPTPKNVKNESYCTWTDANNGAAPNFDGTYGAKGTSYANPVGKNVGNFACDYSSWGEQQAWYPKKDANNKTTYNVISDNKARTPGETSTKDNKTYCSNGDLQTETTETYQSDVLMESITKTYDCNTGTQIDYVHRKFAYSTGKETYYRHIESTSQGVKKYDRKTSYQSNGKMTEDHQYFYNSSTGKMKEKYDKVYDKNTYEQIDYIHSLYNSAGDITYYRHLKYYPDTTTKYDRKIDYDEEGNKLDDSKINYYSNGKKQEEYLYQYDPNVFTQTDYIHRKFATNGQRTYYRHLEYHLDTTTKYDRKIRNDSAGHVLEDIQTNYYEDGKVQEKKAFEYDPNTFKEISYIRNSYNANGTASGYCNKGHHADGTNQYARVINYDGTGQVTDDRKTHYYSGGQQKDNYIKEYYSTGQLKDSKEYQYDPDTYKEVDYIREIYNEDGIQTYYRHLEWYSTGIIKYDRQINWTDDGKKTSDTKKSYDKNGNLE